jgi:hypothetical protein
MSKQNFQTTDIQELVELPCAEKLVFDTKAQAEASAVVADYQHGIRLKAYVCRHCQLWHLSSNSAD